MNKQWIQNCGTQKLKLYAMYTKRKNDIHLKKPKKNMENYN